MAAAGSSFHGLKIWISSVNGRNHNHRPCRWFAQAPLGPFTSRAYRLTTEFLLHGVPCCYSNSGRVLLYFISNISLLCSPSFLLISRFARIFFLCIPKTFWNHRRCRWFSFTKRDGLRVTRSRSIYFKTSTRLTSASAWEKAIRSWSREKQGNKMQSAAPFARSNGTAGKKASKKLKIRPLRKHCRAVTQV